MAKMFLTLSKKKVVLLGALVLLALIFVGISTGLYIHSRIYNDKSESSTNEDTNFNHTNFEARGAVVTNGNECAPIVKDIINEGGSIADAGIVGLLCEGVVMAQSTGLGGGFVATIYDRKSGKVETLDARETAPAAASVDMYDRNPKDSQIGGLSIAVPGEVRGYIALHKKYGKLPWKQLFPPVIKLCQTGFKVTNYLEDVYAKKAEMLHNDGFRDEFIDPETGEPKKQGDIVKRLKLAKTLQLISEEPDVINQGTLTEILVQEIKSMNGIITKEDFNNYWPKWNPSLNLTIRNNLTVHAFPPPGSGAVLAHILGILENFIEIPEGLQSADNWQRIVESFKFAYGKRTFLGDPYLQPEIAKIVQTMLSESFINETRAKISLNKTSQDPAFYGANVSFVEDHGTAHINILAPNGDAISLTGTINLIFGSQRMSPSTGIIFNDEMDDFSIKSTNMLGLPASPSNYIAPGKRPLSSMCPTIILDPEGNVRLLVGAAGGTRITTSSALVTLRHLWFGENVQEAVAASRLHHQLFPMEISADLDYSKDILGDLQRIGHRISSEKPNGFGAVTAISNFNGNVMGSFDPRRSGAVVYI